MSSMHWPDFDDVSLDDLRRRRSEKWTKYPADVLPSAVAEMDFALAQPVRDRLHAAVDLGDTGYASPDQHELAEAYATFCLERLGWPIDPAGVLPVTDVMVGVAEVLRRVTSPGAGVIINPPVYPPFFSTIHEVGRRVVEAPLARSGDRYELDLDAVGDAFRAGAQAYLLCNPHNPTGRVWSPTELSAVADLAERYDATVLVDEVHAPLVLAGARHQPYVALGGYAAQRGVTISAASKGWNFPGLKCAVLVTEPGPMRALADGLPSGSARPSRSPRRARVVRSVARWRALARWPARGPRSQSPAGRRVAAEAPPRRRLHPTGSLLPRVARLPAARSRRRPGRGLPRARSGSALPRSRVRSGRCRIRTAQPRHLRGSPQRSRPADGRRGRGFTF